MYLLDTNILSAIRQRRPETLEWLRSTTSAQCHVSVVSLGEIEKGIRIAETRDVEFSTRLQRWLDAIRDEFATRTFSIDVSTALAWGRIAAGRSRGAPDALIAATAIVQDLTLVTRNIRDFVDLPIKLLNPWER